MAWSGVVYDGLSEQGVVASEGKTHGLGMFFPEFCAALNIGKEKINVPVRYLRR